MRIREIYFNDFRSFRSERKISFVDPVTDDVRPITVLAGSNGSGKTSILETIEALLSFIIKTDKLPDLLAETLESSLIIMTMEFSPSELELVLRKKSYHPFDTSKPRIVYLAIGNYQKAPAYIDSLAPQTYGHLIHTKRSRAFEFRDPLIEQLHAILSERPKVVISERSNLSLSGDFPGGLLLFPHDRQLGKVRHGTIEPPPMKSDWVYRYDTPTKWQGSLEQLWVWQNYLDLERGARNGIA